MLRQKRWNSPRQGLLGLRVFGKLKKSRELFALFFRNRHDEVDKEKMTFSWLRRSTQLIVLALAVQAGLSAAMGWSRYGVERFCPFGGVETLWSVITNQRFICATGPYNLTLFVALLGLTFVARRSFCSWVCPVGTVLEWLGRLGGRLRKDKGGDEAPSLGLVRPRGPWDRILRFGRIAVLALVVFATVGTRELEFRPYDPYYVLLSFFGHDVQWWSYALLLGVLASAVVIPMAWCRYLCPLGGVLWPASRVGLLRISRAREACTSCGRCERACPQAISVSRTRHVASGECTLCMECTSACGTSGALRVETGHAPRRVPRWSVLLLLGVATAAGLAGAGAVTLPSYERVFREGAPSSPRALAMTIDGVRCVDTAKKAAAQLEGLQGVFFVRARAADRLLEVTYDSAMTSPQAISEAIEGPVFEEATGAFLFGVFRVLDAVGGPLEGP